jgi:EAL domain-containing protein (putative c-di-GMP-specific phosphodiesterase class I)
MFAKSMTLSKADINRAFSAREFAIVLQPQIEVADGSVVAVEAFVRWNHPSFGTMTPQLFLPFVDAHGESARLLDTVVRLGLGAASALGNAGRDWRVSVNLGAADLLTGVAPDVITAALRESPAGADRLVLEAPEAALVDGDPLVRLALERLRAMGCGVALDSGGSLPLEASEAAPELFSEIKIGGAAILRFAEIARKVDGGRIARRLLFARKNGLRSVAVGVEQEKTLAALVKLGFGAVQGALICKPLSLEALLAWDGAWRGEVDSAPSAPAPFRQRPRLVSVGAPAPTPAAKLVEQLTPATVGFSFEEEDDALDVDFDDETFGPGPARAEEVEIEQDPSDDVMLDGEELHALSNAAPLHAGMIERPRKTALQRVPVAAFAPAPEGPFDENTEPSPEPMFDRPLALRVKTTPVKQGVFAKLGRLLRR